MERDQTNLLEGSKESLGKEDESVAEETLKSSARLKSGGLGFKRVITAVRYSLNGFASSLKHEAAFRQEMILAVFLIPIALWLPVDPAAKVWLVAAMVLVLVVELINSAIESVVDYISLSLHPLAKRAKDMASAAVFLTMVNLVFAWGYILFSYRMEIFGLE